MGPDRAQYGLAAFVVLIGAIVLFDATRLDQGFSDQPVQPYAMSYAVGSVLVVLGIGLAVAAARGNRPEAEGGEDVDLAGGTDLRTLLILVAVLIGNLLLIDFLGWAITGALLFAGVSLTLGARSLWRNLLLGTVLSVGTWYAFYVLLGVPIPAGILDGVL